MTRFQQSSSTCATTPQNRRFTTTWSRLFAIAATTLVMPLVFGSSGAEAQMREKHGARRERSLGDTTFTLETEPTPATPDFQLADRVITMNEADHCRLTDDPFEFPAMVIPDPVIQVDYPELDQGPAGGRSKPILTVDLIGDSGGPGTHPLHEGECLNSTFTRPVTILSDQQIKKYGIEADRDSIVVANIRTIHGFYYGVIPLDRVETVEWRVTETDRFPFSDDGLHLQSVVNFSEPVTLLRQIDTEGPQKLAVSSLVFSVDPVTPAGVTMDDIYPIFDGSAVAVPAVYTTDFKYQLDMVYYGDTTIRRYLLALPAGIERAEIVAFLELGTRERFSEHFYIDFVSASGNNNCATMRFEILDKLLSDSYTQEQRNKLGSYTGDTGHFFPEYLENSLRLRGIFGEVLEPRPLSSFL